MRAGGNGSDELLTIVIRAFAGPKRVVAYPTPTYSLYPTLAAIDERAHARRSRTRAISRCPPGFSARARR